MKYNISEELYKIDQTNVPPIFFPEHHLSHAASAFYPSPFKEAAILTIDGVGEWATTSIAHGNGKKIEVIKDINFPHSLGLFYSAVTAYCGFRVNSGEYKLMGLAPYGNKNSDNIKRLVKIIRDNLINILDDGSFALNFNYFSYPVHTYMFYSEEWEKLFGFPPRLKETPTINQNYIDLAMAVQILTEDIVCKLSKTARSVTGSNNLCAAGGVALNCCANGKLLKTDIFKNIWVQPAAGDAGGALGAALALYHIGFDQERCNSLDEDLMEGSYLGPEWANDEIVAICRAHGLVYDFLSDAILYEVVSRLLASGNIIGWFQGRMEYGPRALGNRSILADPRIPDMQKRLNLKIKFREGFRPFAPAIQEEFVSQYFKINKPSPYMLFVADVEDKFCFNKEEEIKSCSLFEKLYSKRSQFQAITHVDFSARVQSVSKKTNLRFWRLLDVFREQSGCPILVNTSFNVRGEPIVCSPDDAISCFFNTDMDVLVLNNCIIKKLDNMSYESKKKDFILD